MTDKQKEQISAMRLRGDSHAVIADACYIAHRYKKDRECHE